METPSSMRRVTRSQTSAATQKNEKEDDVPSSRNGERLPLLDITNDSPIVGLATGSLIEKTPSSWVVKSRDRAKRTPGSGEALLRGHVKALLQKVEDEAELVNNHPSGHPTASFRAPLGLPDSSTQQLLAPTPANNPHIPNISCLKEDRVPVDANPPWLIGRATIHQQVVASLKQEESLDLQECCLINRAWLFDDSPEKSDASTISSFLTLPREAKQYRRGGRW
ncbi:hypothetical protein COCNU_10G002260 [Cocos nucifera]|uniref:Uncharacterized protein n=1 Tax=Cocos nucifera TaxID=13894 RepID=A0A8K0N827_COCNU|nr:hypothetical protein COCNU_10G002260 [Cocos nucifera]